MSKLNLLLNAKKKKQAIGAFNISSIEALHAIFRAAAKYDKPVIIQTSRGESEHLIPEAVSSLARRLSQLYGVNYILHLDRGQSIDWIKRCLDAGYDSVTAESTDPNKPILIEQVLKIKELAKRYDAIVEGALEVVPLKYYKNKQHKHMHISEPKKLADFVNATQVDTVVVSIGTQSGALKKIKKIYWNVLKKANEIMPGIPFVLHGGSFLPKSIVKKAIKNGITKINVNAELRLAYTNKLKQNIQQMPEEYAPYRLLKGVIEEMQKIVEDKILLFSNHEQK